MSADHDSGLHAGPKPFHQVVFEATGVKFSRCYQCGKCSAGCPVATEMEYPPSVIMRMLQTGDPMEEEKVLRSTAIWLCVNCETCYSRCPMEVDIPNLMDSLRAEALRRNIVGPGASEIITFHRQFLSSIENNARLYELGLITGFKFSCPSHMLQDVFVGAKMFFKGKINILPESTAGKDQVARIFARCVNKEVHP